MGDTFGTPVYSADGVVAAPHYLASLAGIGVLRDGGSAVDAAIAANLVLAVVWPHMCGPGGDLFAQIWSGSEHKLFGLNASGRAGSRMSASDYRAQGMDSMPVRGVLSINDVLLADEAGQPKEKISMEGLELPRVLGLSVVSGAPLLIEALRGEAATPGAPSGFVPVPVIPNEC